MRAWLLVAVLGSGCNAIMGGLIAAAEGPPSAEGHLVGGGHPPSFVQKPEAIFALHKGRLLRLQTDGSANDELLDHVELAEVSPAGDAVATFGDRGLWGVDAYSLNPASAAGWILFWPAGSVAPSSASRAARSAATFPHRSV